MVPCYSLCPPGLNFSWATKCGAGAAFIDKASRNWLKIIRMVDWWWVWGIWRSPVCYEMLLHFLVKLGKFQLYLWPELYKRRKQADLRHHYHSLHSFSDLMELYRRWNILKYKWNQVGILHLFCSVNIDYVYTCNMLVLMLKSVLFWSKWLIQLRPKALRKEPAKRPHQRLQQLQTQRTAYKPFNNS